MASPARPTLSDRIAAAPPPIELLSDDLLAEILLRLPTLSDLGRAAASWAAFRRVAAGRAFLRRLRSVHPSPLLGLIFLIIHPMRSLVRPVELPHSSAPYARAFAERVDLSFSFLPSSGTWIPMDARDGRVLLELTCENGRFSLVVCDPLSRRYALLPQIPGDLATHSRRCIQPFLVPASDEEAETSFRVVCAVRDAANQLVAFVFSSATGQWSTLATGIGMEPSRKLAMLRSYAYSCFYWKVDGTDDLIVFDTHTLEFSFVHIPFSQDQQRHRDHVIVEAEGGRLGVFSLSVDYSITSAGYHLVYAIQENSKDGNSSWRIERRVRLSSSSSRNLFSIAAATDRYLLLSDGPKVPLESDVVQFETEYFSLEFESMKIEKIYSMRLRNSGVVYAKMYDCFPPSLCLPSI